MIINYFYWVKEKGKSEEKVGKIKQKKKQRLKAEIR